MSFDFGNIFGKLHHRMKSYTLSILIFFRSPGMENKIMYSELNLLEKNGKPIASGEYQLYFKVDDYPQFDFLRDEPDFHRMVLFIYL